MPEVVYIARCPEHGLHGERTECFVCGGEVEQVAMVEISDEGRAALTNLAIATERLQKAVLNYEIGQGTASYEHMLIARSKAVIALRASESARAALVDHLAPLTRQQLPPSR
jgi:hypothetical protein